VVESALVAAVHCFVGGLGSGALLENGWIEQSMTSKSVRLAFLLNINYLSDFAILVQQFALNFVRHYHFTFS
jgi:hypothetical protein